MAAELEASGGGLTKARNRYAVTVLALAEPWEGLTTLAFYTDWQTSFWITALSAIVFFGAARSIQRIGST